MGIDELRFVNELHRERFYKLVEKSTISLQDKERVPLFFLLSIFGETYSNVDDLYDFNKNLIKIKGLNESWQTGGTRKMSILAFNLYNGYIHEEQPTLNSVRSLLGYFNGDILESIFSIIRYLLN